MSQHQKIVEKLRLLYPGQDLSVYVGRCPFGFFIWSEETEKHEHITPKHLMWAIGDKLPLEHVTL